MCGCHSYATERVLRETIFGSTLYYLWHVVVGDGGVGLEEEIV